MNLWNGYQHMNTWLDNFLSTFLFLKICTYGSSWNTIQLTMEILFTSNCVWMWEKFCTNYTLNMGEFTWLDAKSWRTFYVALMNVELYDNNVTCSSTWCLTWSWKIFYVKLSFEFGALHWFCGRLYVKLYFECEDFTWMDVGGHFTWIFLPGRCWRLDFLC